MSKKKIVLVVFLVLVIGLFLTFFLYKRAIKKEIAQKVIELPIAEIFQGRLPDNPFIQAKNVFNTRKVYIYSAKYLKMEAGEAVLAIEQGDKHGELKISANVKTASAVSAIYSLDSRMETRVNAKSFVPLVSTIIQTDTFSKIKRRTLFDYKENKIRFLEKGFRVHHGEYTRQLDLPLDRVYFDELSAVFLPGFVELTPNSSISIPVVSNRRRYLIKLSFKDYREIELPGLGKVRALEAQAEISKEGKKYQFGEVSAYISPAHGNVPVLIKGKLKTKKFRLGEITIALKEIK